MRKLNLLTVGAFIYLLGSMLSQVFSILSLAFDKIDSFSIYLIVAFGVSVIASAYALFLFITRNRLFQPVFLALMVFRLDVEFIALSWSTRFSVGNGITESVIYSFAATLICAIVFIPFYTLSPKAKAFFA